MQCGYRARSASRNSIAFSTCGRFCPTPARESIRAYSLICTHLGCSPTFRPEVAPADLGPAWKGGFFCPCHGSKFDISGRVFKDVPAPTNLPVPPYRYLSDTRILIGAEAENA